MKSLSLTAALAAFTLAGSTSAQSITDLVVADSNLTILEQAVIKAGLADTLDTTQGITVFAPTDRAFRFLPTPIQNILKTNNAALQAVLEKHVVVGEFLAADVAPLDDVVTLGGESVDISAIGDDLFVDRAAVRIPDVLASNGIVHVIDRVLLTADLEAQLLALGGGGTFPDFLAFLTADPQFSTLVDVATQAGILDVLVQEGITLFAPTNAAFAAVDPADLATITGDPDKLLEVLTYHVVFEELDASEVTSQPGAMTANGADLTFSTMGMDVFVDQARVEEADNFLYNGVIHVIDAVLVPQGVL